MKREKGGDISDELGEMRYARRTTSCSMGNSSIAVILASERRPTIWSETNKRILMRDVCKERDVGME